MLYLVDGILLGTFVITVLLVSASNARRGVEDD
jgi:hypothetical protein